MGGRLDAEGKRINGFALAMYGFSPAGLITDASGSQTDVPLQCLLDNDDSNDDIPGVFVREGGRISLVEMQTAPTELRIYCGTTNGKVIEFMYEADTLTPSSFWDNGNYFEEIMDCNAYKIVEGGQDTVRVVVAKRSETFEIVSPPDLP